MHELRSRSVERWGLPLTSFLVVGDGIPAKAAVAAIASASSPAALALLTPKPDQSGVAAFARASGAEVLNADLLRDPAGMGWLQARRFDWLISANNMLIIPSCVLALFSGRAVNCHPGILPEYAGVHVHQWAIRNGEREFGVTLHRMEAAIDAGAILAEHRFPIEASDTGLSLFTKCMRASARIVAEFVSAIRRGAVPAGRPQCLERRRVYRAAAAMDGRIDWSWPAQRAIDFIRAGNYEPLASPTYTAKLELKDGSAIDVLRAEPAGPSGGRPGDLLRISATGPVMACGDARAIRVTRARKGGKVLTAEDWHAVAGVLGADHRAWIGTDFAAV